MPEILQKVPSGLNSFFELKGAKAAPQLLSSELLVPQVELLEWYFATNGNDFSNGPTAVAAVGFTAISAVSVVAWQVFDFASIVSATLTAGQAFRGCLAISYDQGVAAKLEQLSDYCVNQAVNEQVLLSARKRVFVPAGAALGVYCSALAAGPINFSFHARQNSLTPG